MPLTVKSPNFNSPSLRKKIGVLPNYISKKRKIRSAVVAERTRALRHGMGGPRFESRLGQINFWAAGTWFPKISTFRKDGSDFDKQLGHGHR